MRKRQCAKHDDNDAEVADGHDSTSHHVVHHISGVRAGNGTFLDFGADSPYAKDRLQQIAKYGAGSAPTVIVQNDVVTSIYGDKGFRPTYPVEYHHCLIAGG